MSSSSRVPEPAQRFYVRSMTISFDTLQRLYFPTLLDALEWVKADTEAMGAEFDDFCLIHTVVRLSNTADVLYRIIDEQDDMLEHWNALPR